MMRTGDPTIEALLDGDRRFVPDPVIDLTDGPYVRPAAVARVRSYLAGGGSWAPKDVADRLVQRLVVERLR